jgi:rfaE bifunctional protein kinase chain/domain
MESPRLQHILAQFQKQRILIVGDFFLDKYLFIDPALDEISIETGLTAYQIVGKRSQPGAAGTVCNNLSALGVGGMTALGFIGDDGEGYELRQELEKRRVDTSYLILREDRFTPTYTKPMRKNPEGDVEMNRQDTKNRSPLPPELEDEIITRLTRLAPLYHAVILLDQVQERNCGVITDRVREAIVALADQYPRIIFYADSREYIGLFNNVIIKPNRFEAAGAVHIHPGSDIPTEEAILNARQLQQQTGKPVFLTLDKEGICPITEQQQTIIPCPPVTEPVDIVGAGDSVSAGIVSALASGANEIEAAIIGNLVASITIRQLGTTGTATQEQVREAWEKHKSLYEEFS